MQRVWFGLMCAFLAAGAAAARQSRTLTLESAVQLAIEKNVTVIQARNTVDAQHSSTQAAYGALLPSLEATGSFSRRHDWTPATGGTYFQNGIPVSFNTGGYSASNSYGTSLRSSIVLFDGFSNTSNVSRAQANATAAEHNADRTRQTAVYQTHQLYLNVVRTNQLLSVSEDNLKRSRRQLERITESNKVGAVALADVYRQQVQVGSDELGLIQAQSAYEKAKADLIAYIGVDFDGEYLFDFAGIPSDIDTMEFGSVNGTYADFQGVVRTALEARPDRGSAVEGYNSAEASVRMARGGHYPTVSALASYGYNNTDLDRITDNRNLLLGLNVSLPIFSGFSTQNQIQQAEVQRRNASEQLKQNERLITVDIRKALLDLEAAEKQVKVTQTSVASAEMDRKIAEEKYTLGAGTLLDLLIASANYTTTLSNKVNAVTGYLLAKKQMEYAVGTISN